MRSRMTLLRVLTCCLAMAACQQSDVRRDYPAPPSDSYRTESLPLTTGDTSNPIRVAFVTPAFFQAVRDKPLLGRAFNVEEHQSKNQERVVILSHRLWQQRFGAEPSMIGESGMLGGHAHKIIGVMPQGFDIPAGAEAWLPEAESNR